MYCDLLAQKIGMIMGVANRCTGCRRVIYLECQVEEKIHDGGNAGGIGE